MKNTKSFKFNQTFKVYKTTGKEMITLFIGWLNVVLYHMCNFATRERRLFFTLLSMINLHKFM